MLKTKQLSRFINVNGRVKYSRDVWQKWKRTVLTFQPEQTMELIRVVAVDDCVIYCYKANHTIDVTLHKSENNFTCVSLNIRYVEKFLN
jgi:hypothetical protein